MTTSHWQPSTPNNNHRKSSTINIQWQPTTTNDNQTATTIDNQWQRDLKQDRHRQGWPQTEWKEWKQNRQRTNRLETGQTQAGLTSNKTDLWQERWEKILNITSRFPRCFSHLWWCFSLSWPTAISSWPIPAPSGYHLNSSLRNCLLLSIMWIS